MSNNLPLEARNASLTDLVELLQQQHSQKVDIVAASTAISARFGDLVVAGADQLLTIDGVTTVDGVYRPTAIADEGLAAKLNIPLAYLRRMREQRPDLYDVTVNGWLHGDTSATGGRHAAQTASRYPADPRSFLLRAFRGEDGIGVARAFLSDRYAPMDNLDVLTAALDGVRQAGVAVQIAGADLSERRMYVRVFSPDVAEMAAGLLAGYRSPFDDPNVRRVPGAVPDLGTVDGRPLVFAGFEISNSETGGGAFSITPRLLIQVCSNGLTVPAKVLRKVHVGAKLDEGEIDWSQETNERALALVTSKTTDAVRTFLSPEFVRRTVTELEALAGAPVVDAEKTLGTVVRSAKLTLSAEHQSTVLEHFLLAGQRTAGGLMQAFTSAAQTVADPEAAHTLEASAVRVLEFAAAGVR